MKPNMDSHNQLLVSLIVQISLLDQQSIYFQQNLLFLISPKLKYQLLVEFDYWNLEYHKLILFLSLVMLDIITSFILKIFNRVRGA